MLLNDAVHMRSCKRPQFAVIYVSRCNNIKLLTPVAKRTIARFCILIHPTIVLCYLRMSTFNALQMLKKFNKFRTKSIK